MSLMLHQLWRGRGNHCSLWLDEEIASIPPSVALTAPMSTPESKSKESKHQAHMLKPHYAGFWLQRQSRCCNVSNAWSITHHLWFWDLIVWVVSHWSLVAACKRKTGLEPAGLICEKWRRASWPISSHRSCCNTLLSHGSWWGHSLPLWRETHAVHLTSLPTHRPAFTSLLFSSQPSDEGLTTAILKKGII